VPFTVKEAENGDILKSNHVYIAPGGKQMSLVRSGSGFQIVVNDDAPVNRFKPSVDYMFLRLAEIKELRFVAGIFTGMGRDGAEGLLALKKAGALTFAQDEASSAVYGMPRAAFELGAADEVLPLDEISQNLLRLSQRHQSRAA
jgi:two-component system chemotaxis response regulator CheB